MGLMNTAALAAHAIVFFGSVLLLWRKRSLSVLTMVVGAGMVLFSETISFLAVNGYVSDSTWLYYLGWGMPIGSTSIGWFVFAAGLLVFAILDGRNRETSKLRIRERLT